MTKREARFAAGRVRGLRAYLGTVRIGVRRGRRRFGKFVKSGVNLLITFLIGGRFNELNTIPDM